MYDGVEFFFFFKQKTAYEMRISDWSSDVCSSDLQTDAVGLGVVVGRDPGGAHRRALAHQIGITGKLKTQQGIAGSDLLPQRLRAQRGQTARDEKSAHVRYALIPAPPLGQGVHVGTKAQVLFGDRPGVGRGRRGGREK